MTTKFNIYEVRPPEGVDNVDPDEPPKRVLAASARQAVDMVHGSMLLGTCFRYLKLGEIPWLADDLRCVAVEENVDNPDGRAKILDN